MEQIKRKVYYIFLQFLFVFYYSLAFVFSSFVRKTKSDKKRIAAVWYCPIGLTGSNLRLGNWKPYFEKDNIVFDNFYTYTFEEMVAFDDGKWSVKYLFYMKLLRRRFWQFIQLKNYDIAWIDRGFLPIYPLKMAFFERCIKRMGVERIIDTSDGGDYLNNKTLVLDTMGQADKITVAYKFLFEFYSERFPKVYWINWTIPTDGYIVKTDYTIQEKIPVLGWMGSPANGVHLEQLCDVLSLVASKRKFILRYMCRTPLNLIIPNAIIEHLSFENYYENIRSFDIGLCPFLTVDIRSKGKIAMKNQEYMMCAIPQVCSHVAISEHLVNGESALIAENIDQWEKHILEIIDNIDLREKLGTNSYKIFNQYYLYDIEYANLKKSLIN